ncbi:hypothetical protein VTL71DRAFT_11287 [Oculimacula yallundae]|uniref:Uncharacterized protein n=1 Tax=Oculimacula yallundae TaxID=86028 RepID=A0ABR4CS91_9HELO
MSAIMKTFFIALLALPAVLASPTPAPALPVLANDFECTCTNGAGDRTDADCVQFGGARDERSWCRPFGPRSLNMNKRFTDEFCAANDSFMPKADCHPVKLCQNSLIPTPGYYMVCPE